MARKSYYRSLDVLWREYFRDPSQWWDNRKSKAVSAHPDFTHKSTKECLWIHGSCNPFWVVGELNRRELVSVPTEPELCIGSYEGPADFVRLLRACAKNKDLSCGTRIHNDILKQGLLVEKYPDTVVTMHANLDAFKGQQSLGYTLLLGTALVDMYAKCGALIKAQQVLEELPIRDAISWSTLIAGCVQQGQGEQALHCFEQLQQEGFSSDALTFALVLKACSSIRAADKGKQIHDEIARNGLLEKNTVLGNALVDMYAKCGALAKARQVLEELPLRNVVTWSALISGYAQLGQGEQALECFERMQGEGISPNSVTYLCILKACGSIGAADKGEHIHDQITRQGLLGKDIALGSALVDMYAKCGALTKAQRVLEGLPVRNVVSWTELIKFPRKRKPLTEAQRTSTLEHLSKKLKTSKETLWIHGCSIPLCGDAGTIGSRSAMPTHVQDCMLSLDNQKVVHSFVASLRSCGKTKDLFSGTRVHHDILKGGFLEQCADALVTMYAKCGALEKAKALLDFHSSRDAFPWTDLIAGYAQVGRGQDALNCYEKMQNEGVFPDAVTFACALKACGSIRAVDKGIHIYNEIVSRGLLRDDVVLGTAVVDMFAKCGDFMKAQQVLEEIPVRNVVSWTAIITGYAQQHQAKKALSCFELMQHEGFTPNAMTFACVMKACGALRAADKGERIYEEIHRQGLLKKDIVLGAAVVDMFAKCGALAKAYKVLEEQPVRNVISWNALITGFVQHGQAEQALNCYERLQREGLSPNGVTFLCILKACSSIGAIDMGEQMHDKITRQGFVSNNTRLGNALIDMYARGGCLVKAQQVLEKLPVQDIVSWNTLLTGYAQEGQGEKALNCFEHMQHKGLAPDAVTMLCILKSCGVLGLAKDAQMHFMRMVTKYGIQPDFRHYTCMVDAFGRAGHLGKALGLLYEFPSFDHSFMLWSALLSACKKWGGKSVGRWAFEHALRVNKSDVAG